MPGNKPGSFQMPLDVFDTLPAHAKGQLPPTNFGGVAPERAIGPAEHYAPQATVELPDAAADGIAHAPDWVLI